MGPLKILFIISSASGIFVPMNLAGNYHIGAQRPNPHLYHVEDDIWRESSVGDGLSISKVPCSSSGHRVTRHL